MKQRPLIALLIALLTLTASAQNTLPSAVDHTRTNRIMSEPTQLSPSVASQTNDGYYEFTIPNSGYSNTMIGLGTYDASTGKFTGRLTCSPGNSEGAHRYCGAGGTAFCTTAACAGYYGNVYTTFAYQSSYLGSFWVAITGLPVANVVKVW